MKNQRSAQGARGTTRQAPHQNKGSTNAKGAKNKKNVGTASKVLAVISRLMPYILAVIFVIMLFTIVGKLSFSNIIYGLFSTYAPVFILAFLLYHSLMWYYDTKRKICARRVCCSVIIVLAVSMIQHISYASRAGIDYKSPDATVPNIFQLYELGKAGNGGGAIGGGLCGMLLSSIGKGFTVAIILIVMLFMFLQMFNITPVSIFKSIFKNKLEAKKAQKDAEKRRALVKKKHKNFQIFDDEDDEFVVPDESIISDIIDDGFGGEDDNDATIIDEVDDDATLAVNRQPINDGQRTPVQRSASPYRFTPTTTSSYDNEDDDSSDDNDDANELVQYDADNNVDEIASDDAFDESDDIDATEDFDDDSAEDIIDGEDVNEVNADEVDEDATDDAAEEANEDDEADELPYVEPAPAVTTPAATVTPQTTTRTSPVSSPSVSAGNAASKPIASSNATTVSAAEKPAPKPVKKKRKHIFPPIDLFEQKTDVEDEEAVNEELQENARIIVETLKSFNINTRIVDISRGPTVTRYELMPEAGVKVRSISNLVDDIALYLAADGIRMECPIPGKSAVGIEVPNKITSMVYLRSLLEDPKFKQAKSPVTCAVGKSISGENVYVDIAKLVHLLVAGATGQGKSVCINALLVSLLYKASPDDLRLILIDPKRVEFAPYNGIPHLLVPVVTDVKKSVGTLQWSVSEMERRFELLEGAGVRDIGEYNDRVERGIIEDEKIPRIIIVIDELYDLKMQVPEIDDYIIRLTQKARAAGIHVIIGTQRPSVDVITGVIKANIPSRIAFRVPAQVDSRTILDEVGAEKLVARGDMLLKPVGALKPIRVQGAFITEDEREAVTNFLKANSSENYDEDVISQIESNTAKLQKAEKRNDSDGEGSDGNDLDEKFYAALEIAVEMGKISSSYLQRKLNLGFQRAARIIDQMEALGYIGEANGSKPRDVLITKQDYLELRMKHDGGGEN